MHLPRWLFEAERAALLLSLLLLWPAFLSQLLVWRFTPKKKWNQTKLRLILVGLGGLVIETIRAPDISAGFGLMSIMTQRMLYQQFGAVVLPVAVLVLLATAKSLSVQLSRPLPPIFPRLMWALIAINQILVLPTLIGNLIATRDNNPDGLMFWWAFNMWAWAAVTWLLFIVDWCLFLGLRKRVSAYLVMLEQQAARRKQTAAAVAATVTVAAVTVVPESKRATMDKKMEQPVQLDQSAAASLSTSPLLAPAAPSDGLVELSDPNPDGAAKHSACHLSSTRPATIATSGTTTPTDAAGSTVPSSLQLPSSPSAHKNSSPTVGPSSGSNAALLRLDPSSGGSSFSFSAATPSAPVDASSSPARLVRPTLAQVAPVPQRAVPLGGVPQSDARLDELRGAVRKLNIMTVFMSIPLVGTSCVAIPNLLRYADGEILDEIVRSPTADSDGFPWLSGAATSFTLVALLVALYEPTRTFDRANWHRGTPLWNWGSEHAPDVPLTFLLLCCLRRRCLCLSPPLLSWYAWVSPRCLSAAALRSRGLRFWPTLLRGVDEDAWERYAHQAHNDTRKAEAAPTATAIAGGRLSSPAAAATAASSPHAVVRVAPTAARSTHASAAVPGVTAATAANATRNAW